LIAARAALLLASALVLAACSENKAEQIAAAPPVPVTTAQALVQDVPLALQVVGRAEAFESVTLK